MIQNTDAHVAQVPFTHGVIDNFLDEKTIQEVCEALSEEEFMYKESDLFQFKQTPDFSGSPVDTLQRIRAFFCSDAFVSLMEKHTGVLFKRGVVDLAGTLYEDTDFLLCHDDQLDERRLAFLLYLNDFEQAEGGSLNLFTEKNGVPTRVVKKIVPKYNRLAFFVVSTTSFHEVEEVVVDKQRIALGGWLHGRE